MIVFSLICKECTQDALDNNGNCPICNLLITSIQPAVFVDDDYYKMCLICYDQKVNCIGLPCENVFSCFSWMSKLLRNINTCPVCKNEISGIKKIYFDF